MGTTLKDPCSNGLWGLNQWFTTTQRCEDCVTQLHDSQLLQATQLVNWETVAQGKKLDSRVCYVFVSLLLIFVVLAFDACIIFSGMSPGCQSQIQEWINQGSYA